MVRSILVSAAAAAAIAAATPASAAYIFTVGHSETFAFNGLVDPGPVVVPGLTASLTLTLNSIAGNKATFACSLANTSAAPVTNSRVSIFGFNVLGANKPTGGTATPAPAHSS